MQNLRTYRLAAGMSQTELGRLVGTSPGRISYIEIGKHSPSLNIAMKLAAVFDCTLDDLVREPEGAICKA